MKWPGEFGFLEALDFMLSKINDLENNFPY